MDGPVPHGAQRGVGRQQVAGRDGDGHGEQDPAAARDADGDDDDVDGIDDGAAADGAPSGDGQHGGAELQDQDPSRGATRGGGGRPRATKRLLQRVLHEFMAARASKKRGGKGGKASQRSSSKPAPAKRRRGTGHGPRRERESELEEEEGDVHDRLEHSDDEDGADHGQHADDDGADVPLLAAGHGGGRAQAAGPGALTGVPSQRDPAAARDARVAPVFASVVGDERPTAEVAAAFCAHEAMLRPQWETMPRPAQIQFASQYASLLNIVAWGAAGAPAVSPAGILSSPITLAQFDCIATCALVLHRDALQRKALAASAPAPAPRRRVSRHRRREEGDSDGEGSSGSGSDSDGPRQLLDKHYDIYLGDPDGEEAQVVSSTHNTCLVGRSGARIPFSKTADIDASLLVAGRLADVPDLRVLGDQKAVATWLKRVSFAACAAPDEARADILSGRFRVLSFRARSVPTDGYDMEHLASAFRRLVGVCRQAYGAGHALDESFSTMLRENTVETWVSDAADLLLGAGWAPGTTDIAAAAMVAARLNAAFSQWYQAVRVLLLSDFEDWMDNPPLTPPQRGVATAAYAPRAGRLPSFWMDFGLRSVFQYVPPPPSKAAASKSPRAAKAGAAPPPDPPKGGAAAAPSRDPPKGTAAPERTNALPPLELGIHAPLPSWVWTVLNARVRGVQAVRDMEPRAGQARTGGKRWCLAAFTAHGCESSKCNYFHPVLKSGTTTVIDSDARGSSSAKPSSRREERS